MPRISSWLGGSVVAGVGLYGGYQYYDYWVIRMDATDRARAADRLKVAQLYQQLALVEKEFALDNATKHKLYAKLQKLKQDLVLIGKEGFSIQQLEEFWLKLIDLQNVRCTQLGFGCGSRYRKGLMTGTEKLKSIFAFALFHLWRSWFWVLTVFVGGPENLAKLTFDSTEPSPTDEDSGDAVARITGSFMRNAKALLLDPTVSSRWILRTLLSIYVEYGSLGSGQEDRSNRPKAERRKQDAEEAEFLKSLGRSSGSSSPEEFSPEEDSQPAVVYLAPKPRHWVEELAVSAAVPSGSQVYFNTTYDILLMNAAKKRGGVRLEDILGARRGNDISATEQKKILMAAEQEELKLRLVSSKVSSLLSFGYPILNPVPPKGNLLNSEVLFRPLLVRGVERVLNIPPPKGYEELTKKMARERLDEQMSQVSVAETRFRSRERGEGGTLHREYKSESIGERAFNKEQSSFARRLFNNYALWERSYPFTTISPDPLGFTSQDKDIGQLFPPEVRSAPIWTKFGWWLRMNTCVYGDDSFNFDSRKGFQLTEELEKKISRRQSDVDEEGDEGTRYSSIEKMVDLKSGKFSQPVIEVRALPEMEAREVETSCIEGWEAWYATTAESMMNSPTQL